MYASISRFIRKFLFQEKNSTYPFKVFVALVLTSVSYTGYPLTVTLLCIASRERAQLLNYQSMDYNFVLGICFLDYQFSKNGKEHSSETLRRNTRGKVFTWLSFLGQEASTQSIWRWGKAASPKVLRATYMKQSQLHTNAPQKPCIIQSLGLDSKASSGQKAGHH